MYHVKSRFPSHWMKREGADHLLFTSEPLGGCSFDVPGHLGYTVRDFTALTLWGMSLNMMGGTEDPCFRYGQDILVPPRVSPTIFQNLMGIEGNSKKNTLLYAPQPVPGEEASPGIVQQRMHELYAGKEEESGVILDGVRDSESRWEKMRTSYFCLIYSGMGWSVTLSEAVISGCIPVVIMVLHPAILCSS